MSLRNHVIFETGLPVAMQSIVIGNGAVTISVAASSIVAVGEAREKRKEYKNQYQTKMLLTS